MLLAERGPPPASARCGRLARNLQTGEVGTSVVVGGGGGSEPETPLGEKGSGSGCVSLQMET